MNETLLKIYTIAIILIVTKLLSLLMRRIGLPPVLGMILGGLLIGKAIWGNIIPPNDYFPLKKEYISTFAEIGVIFVLFSTGLETNLKDLKHLGLPAILIAMGGVIVPLVLGSCVGLIFVYPSTHDIYQAVFFGVIMCATSVGITVEALKEIGALHSRAGEIIVSAAIIDDIIGIIVLTIFMNLYTSGEGGLTQSSSPVLNAINPNGYAIISILWMLVFFVVAIGGGFFISKLFKVISNKHPDTHRLPIFSIAICFLYSFVAEVVFGVADITGAYIAGVVLSTSQRGAMYVDKKIAVNSFTIFAPIFFAGIGMDIAFNGMTWDILLFGLAFVAVAIISKIIGCGATARLCKFDKNESLQIGVGMITRGEVALVVANKGILCGLMDGQHLTVVVALVMISSILAPILLELIYKKNKKKNLPGGNELLNQ